MPPFAAQFTEQEVEIREELIVKYICSLIKDTHQIRSITPYFLDYGIVDWSWPLRFVKGNELYKGFKYYSYAARDAIIMGQRKFRRDHIIPKKILKGKLFSIEDPGNGNVKEIMKRYGEVCVITIDEDLKLTNAGLNNNMPNNWTNNEDDIFARYRAIDIKIWTNNQQW